MSRTRKIASWLLFAAGGFFLYSGARDYLDSRLGQSEVAERWKEPPRLESTDRTDRQVQPRPLPPVSLGEAVAKLTIPRLDAQFYVVEGTGKTELRRGPGHMHGTAMPGTRGNCIIAGHRDTHFRILKDLRRGDAIVLQTSQGEFRYKVTGLTIVSPTNTKSLQPTSQPVLHLITCYPFYYVGPAPKRFVVQADLANAEYAAQPQASPRRPS